MVVIKARRDEDEDDGQSEAGWSEGLFGTEEVRKPTIRKYVFIPMNTEAGVREEILKV